MDKFNLPISYINNKVELPENIITDLELLKINNINNIVDNSNIQINNDLSNNKPLYSYLFNPKNDYAKDNLTLWSKYITTDKKFLKDTQLLIKNKTSYNDLDYEPMITVWNNINNESSFIEKYNYIDWTWFQELNNNPSFLLIWCLYNITSPILTLLIPILFLIFPFFILKMQGISITVNAYTTMLISLLQRHSIGQLFNIGSVSWDKKIYIITSFVFYIIQIYSNFMTCFKFINNTKHIFNEINIVYDYLNHTIDSMNLYETTSNKLDTYKPFINNMILHKKVLISLRDEIYDIIGSKFFVQKFKNIGYIMKIFYQINNLSKFKDSFNYSFGFNGYISNIINIKQEYKNKSINLCKFSNKGTSFKDAYYPTIKNPVKNTYNLNKHMLITGPNAAGKTTLLKTTIFNIIISQQLGLGFYKRAKIKVYDNIHCYINIPDTSNRDSLFQAEARRCKNILDIISSGNKNNNYLCLFDELFSGTNPYEAISSAIAYLQYLSDNTNVNIVITTHFLELCNKLQKNKKFLNYHMNTNQKDTNIEYTYLLKTGISKIKGGIKVLKDLEYPDKIIDDTNKIINNVII